MEDINDKHGSLDFGLGEQRRSILSRKKGKKGVKPPDMTLADTHAMLGHGKGLSLDMGSPYVLPGEPESRGSFNSMSRSLKDVEDPYRPVEMIKSRSVSPNPPYAESHIGSGSLLTANSQTHLTKDTHGPDSSSLMSPSTISTQESPAPPLPVARKPLPTFQSDKGPISPAPQDPMLSPYPAGQAEADQFTLPTTTFQSEFSMPEKVASPVSASTPYPVNDDASPPPPPKRSSLRNASPTLKQQDTSALDDYQTYADVLGIAQAPDRNNANLPAIDEPAGLGVAGVNYGNGRLSVRPLPPDDPADTAEQRAHRIRSFYKEYFSDGDGGEGMWEYDDDYGQEYHGAAIYDPSTGQFIVAGGQNVQRRAMTPPPRGPPRKFHGGPAPYGATRSSGGTMPGNRARAYSSASGRPPMGARGRPVKKLPPPSPLTSLPTPHGLKDDTGIFDVLDFAPPKSVRDRAAGRPGTPGGNERVPYSPSVRAHTPLVTAFDDLAVMPSPHQLRKSTTFTALDFAPPPRFGDRLGVAGSDGGSIRSGTSGRSGHIDAMHMHNIRQGAYRVSRLPADMVGTVDDLKSSLRPRLDMGRQ